MNVIRDVFVLVPINDLEEWTVDIPREKFCIQNKPEFEKNVSKDHLIDKEIDELKLSSTRICDKLISSKLEFKPCKVYLDLWMRDKEDHYEYIIVYFDSLFLFCKDNKGVLVKVDTLKYIILTIVLFY